MLVEGYLAEYCSLIDDALPDEMAQIAAHFALSMENATNDPGQRFKPLEASFPIDRDLGSFHHRRLFDLSIDPCSLERFYAIIKRFDCLKTRHNELFNWFRRKHQVQEAPWKNLGKSKVFPIEYILPRKEAKLRPPVFETLRVSLLKSGKARWELRVRFFTVNRAKAEVVLDDIHTIIYERYARTPPRATVSYHGTALLMQDNSIIKEQKKYSLDPGKGLEIDLVLSASRTESAPAHGQDPHEVDGPIRIIFGLLLDYYFPKLQPINRGCTPSDCLYLFVSSNPGANPEFEAVNNSVIRRMKQLSRDNKKLQKSLQMLEDLLDQHLKLRLLPKP